MSAKGKKSEAEVLAELQAASTEMQNEVEQYDEMDEEIFPGGPTYGEVERFKAEWGDIYSTEFDDEVFIWRTLSRREYKDILKLQKADPMYREERICELCILWPEGYDFIQMSSGKAGIPSILAEQIMDRSGFTPSGEAKKL